jgi:hypothetical protein
LSWLSIVVRPSTRYGQRLAVRMGKKKAANETSRRRVLETN